MLHPEQVAPVADAIALLLAELGDTPLIGFAGAPFTLASYVVEGGPSRNHERTKALMRRDPEVWHALMDRLAELTATFLRAQVAAGVDAVQLFDSWAGALSERDYREFALPHSTRVLGGLADAGVPRIHFGVGTGELLAAMGEAGADVVGVDWRVPLDEAARRVGGTRAVQGNLDPAVLFADQASIAGRGAAHRRGGPPHPGARVQPRPRGAAGDRPGRADPARRAGARPDALMPRAARRGSPSSGRDLGPGRRAPAAHPARAGRRDHRVRAAGPAGGVLRTVDLAGMPFDVGAEAFLARRPEVPRLLGELGLADAQVHPTPAAPLGAGGRPHGAAARRHPARRATRRSRLDGLLSAAGVAAVAAEPDRPLRWDAGADVALGALVRARFGDEVVDRLVDPMLGGVYAGRADALGLRATVPALAAALDAGARSLTAAADAATPAPTGAPGPVFGALRGGYRVLLDALAGAAAAELRLGTTVRELARLPHGWRLTLGPATAPEPLDVDAVVLAVPAPAAARLLAGVAAGPAAAAAEIELASSVVVALAYRAADAATLPPTSGVLVATGEPFAVKGVHASPAPSGRTWAPDGLVRLRASLGRYGEAGTLQVDDAELVAPGPGRPGHADRDHRRSGRGAGAALGWRAAPVRARAPGPGRPDRARAAGRAGGRRGRAARRRRAGLRRHRPGRGGTAGRAARPRRHRGRDGSMEAWPASTTPS